MLSLFSLAFKSMKNIYGSLIPIIPINLLCYELYSDCRVLEICKLSNPLNWHYIVSGSNPIDTLSRGRLISE